jgi:hypothetical protein
MFSRTSYIPATKLRAVNSISLETAEAVSTGKIFNPYYTPMKTFAKITTSYGDIVKIPHDINGNPKYFLDYNIIVSLSISRHLQNPKYRRHV